MSHLHTVMGRIHVNTRHDLALLHAFSVLQRGAVVAAPARSIFYYASEAMKAHEDNRAEYFRVMTGRVK